MKARAPGGYDYPDNHSGDWQQQTLVLCLYPSRDAGAVWLPGLNAQLPIATVRPLPQGPQPPPALRCDLRETGRLPSTAPAQHWGTEVEASLWVQGQLGLHSETS